jgi:energy-coupling factor transporter ATP-binding protein EcfA2
VNLSGGENQRLGIARALLKNAPILLIDEGTSALDEETQAQVKEAIDNLCKDNNAKKRTVVSIAHRPSTVEGCGQIVCMMRGGLCEVKGSYDIDFGDVSADPEAVAVGLLSIAPEHPEEAYKGKVAAGRGTSDAAKYKQQFLDTGQLKEGHPRLRKDDFVSVTGKGGVARFLPSFIHSHSPSFLPSYSPPFIQSFFPSFLHTDLPSFLHYSPSFTQSFLASFLPSCSPSFLPSFTVLPFFLPSFLPFYRVGRVLKYNRDGTPESGSPGEVQNMGGLYASYLTQSERVNLGGAKEKSFPRTEPRGSPTEFPPAPYPGITNGDLRGFLKGTGISRPTEFVLLEYPH